MADDRPIRGGKKESLLKVLEPVLFARPYLRNSTTVFSIVIAAGIISNFTLLLVPVYIGDAVTAVEYGAYSSILHIGLLIVVAYSISAAATFSLNYGGQYISQTYAYNLRKDFVSHLVRKKFLFFETQTSGDLLSRGSMDIEATRNFNLNMFTSLFPTVFLIIEAFVLLFMISPLFSLLLALVVPVLILLGIISSRKQRSIWRKIRDTYGKLGEILQENIVGQRVVRGLASEQKEVDKYTTMTKRYYDENYSVVRARVTFNNLMPLSVAAVSSAIIGAGGYFDIINKASVGGLVAAVTIFAMLTNPVSFLGRMIVFSENSRAAIGRIQEITASGGEEEVEFSNEILQPGMLVFDHVKFMRGSNVILKDVTFRALPGEFIGITGKTGAGKSTMVNLITRYYEADSGTISLGGKDIKNIPLSILRRRISIVPQEIILFSGTIKENILFGIDASDERVREAARIASIDDFIESLPSKYETMIGERGITLSGGQRQRIAIARAVLRDPLIIILDDATSSVDPDTEIIIFNNLKESLKDTVILMISLRASALSFAKKVLVLEEGKLQEDTSGEDGGYVDRI
ncbi:MAG: ABC transporter ATP-binding protein [Thermoplasmatales archaeon]